MATKQLTVENRSTSNVTISARLGALKPGASRVFTDLTEDEMDGALPNLRALSSAGVISYSFADNPDVASSEEEANLSDVEAIEDKLDPGAVPSATLVLTEQPSNEDTVTIGADVYEFCTAAGSVADDTYIGVVIGANAAATQANLLAAINATYASNAHATLFQTDDETPCSANGTEPVLGTSIGTTIRIQYAAAAGGAKKAGNPSIVLAEAITHATDIWKEGNVNLNTLGGRAPGILGGAVMKKTVNAAMIANTGRFSFPFAVGTFIQQIRTSAGVQRMTTAVPAVVADAFTIDNGDVIFTSGGAGAPNAQATDTITILAWPA